MEAERRLSFLDNKILCELTFPSFHCTRNRNEIRLPDIGTENARKCLLYNGVKLFNELPTELKNCDSVNICEKRLAMHVKEYSSF